MGGPMISLTDNAINAGRTAMSGAQGGGVQGLRIMVQTRRVCRIQKDSMGLVRDPGAGRISSSNMAMCASMSMRTASRTSGHHR